MRSRRAALCAVVWWAGTLIACSDGGNGGPGPTPPSQTPVSLAITPATDLIKIKGSETFTATVTYSNGTNGPAQAPWRSDAVSVATVDGSGRATGQASGMATIVAEFQGLTGTRLLRVVPDYQGRWTGRYALTGCSDDGDWRAADFCRELDLSGLYDLSLDLTQTRDAVSGNANFDDPIGPIQGTIRTSGHLPLNGTLRVESEGLVFEVVVSSFEGLTTDNERMTGTFDLTFRHAMLAGSARVACQIRALSKGGPTALVSRPSGAGLGRLVRRVARR
jgi:Bacterial Ig-like domain (group 2)